MISPARKAPRARERPAVKDIQATVRQMRTTVRRKSSLDLSRTTWYRRAGTISFAPTITRTIIPTPFASIKRSGIPRLSEYCAASSGVRSIMGTTTIS